MFRDRLLVSAAAGLFALGFVGGVAAQQSSSKPDNRPAAASPAALPVTPPAGPPPDAPSAALRDLLAAACAHDETNFVRFLTARNFESYTHLSPAARTELMKRFVLLDGAGKPSLTASASGRPAVRCATPDGAAELQLGGAELRDNFALLPLDIRDVSDLQAGEPHHILMGMIRENSSWKIFSLGMLFLDLPSLEVEWDQAAIGSNEQDAVATLKAIAAAVESYRKAYLRLPDTISKLGPSLGAASGTSGKPSADAAGLVDADLATGQNNGYIFRMVIVGANDLGAQAQYQLSATPLTYGRTGKLSFFRDASGVLHAADHRGGVGQTLDPVVR
jgi:hypothetical protein